MQLDLRCSAVSAEGDMFRVDEATAQFGPETLQVLGEAMDKAWQQVELILTNDSAAGAKAVIAEYIFALARRGERDPERLVEGALMRLSL